MKTLRLSLIFATVLLIMAFESRATIIEHRKFIPDEIPLKEFIRLTPHGFFVLTGHRLSLKEKLRFGLLKLSIRKQLKKNPEKSIRDFLAAKDEPGILGVIGLILVGIILVVFILFLLLYQD